MRQRGASFRSTFVDGLDTKRKIMAWILLVAVVVALVAGFGLFLFGWWSLWAWIFRYLPRELWGAQVEIVPSYVLAAASMMVFSTIRSWFRQAGSGE